MMYATFKVFSRLAFRLLELHQNVLVPCTREQASTQGIDALSLAISHIAQILNLISPLDFNTKSLKHVQKLYLMHQSDCLSASTTQQSHAVEDIGVT